MAAAKRHYSLYKFGIPEARNVTQYVTAVAVLRHRAKGQKLYKKLANTDYAAYDPEDNLFAAYTKAVGHNIADWLSEGPNNGYDQPDPNDVLIVLPVKAPMPYGDPLQVKTYLKHADVNRWLVQEDSPLTPTEHAARFYDLGTDSGGMAAVPDLKSFTAVTMGLLLDKHLKDRLVYVQKNGDILVYDQPYQLFAAFDYAGRPKAMKRELDGRVIQSYRSDDRNNGNPALDTDRPAALDRGLTGAQGNEKWKMWTLGDHYLRESKKGGWQDGRIVRYWSPEERRRYEVFVDNQGRLTDPFGTPLDTELTVGAKTDNVSDGAICVMDPNGRIYLTNYSIVAELHHSSFLSGGPVTFAGEMTIKNGTLVKASNKSGHYLPDPACVLQLLQELEEPGVDVKGVKVHYEGK